MAQNSEPALALLVLLLLSVASLAWSPASIADRHEAWMAKFGRRYKDDETKQKRMEIFRDNIAFIEAFNQAGNDTIELGENQFADLTEEEFKAGFMGFKPLAVANDLPFRYANVTQIPSIVDWRLKGAVTPIKNQGQCGSCWAFSAIASVEAIHKIKTGQLISLSEQELVDCDWYDNGCKSGKHDHAFQYIADNNGIASESSYPYHQKVQPCNRTKLPPPAVTIKGFEAPPPYNEDAMAKAVANQPVTVGIAISGQAFQFYKRGVITQNCGGTNVEHSVAIVGYGKNKQGVEFWLAKNQWGAWWGESGYVRIKRNHGVPREGLCLIAVTPSYPVVD